MKSSKIKIYISAAWLIVTFSMVSWWFWYALSLDDNSGSTSLVQKHHRMIMWEGGTLLTIILIGGVYLIWYVYRDVERHERLKLFFSNFSHDIKTSITRIRLQTEVLAEELNEFDVNRKSMEKSMERLLKDLNRLDLQLENSLLMTHINESEILIEKINLKKLVDTIKLEFEKINIILHEDADFYADTRSIRSVFRNLIQNSIVHGKANLINIYVKKCENDSILISLQDNGSGSKIEYSRIGLSMMPFHQSQSNGIGLFLAKKLIHKMSGELSFKSVDASGFQADLVLKGEVLL